MKNYNNEILRYRHHEGKSFKDIITDIIDII